MTDVRTVRLHSFEAQYAPLREAMLTAVTRVFDSQRFILGDEVAAFEREISGYCGARFGIGCGSGSDALLLALMACDVGPGDEVVTTPYTFFATVAAIVRLGATPVLADIDEGTFNLCPAAVRRALAGHDRVKAIVPVHLFGGCADMDPILAAARDYGCRVVEDAAQAIGAEYRSRRAGSIGDIACFSFYPTKNLGAAGEAGLLTTGDETLAERLAALRVHGSRTRYYHDEVGINSRLDAVQAAVLRVKLQALDQWTEARRRAADLYRRELAGAGVAVPVPAAWQTRHIANQFVIRCRRRDALRQALREAGIETEIYYPLPLHLQKCFAALGYAPGSFPVSEAAAATSVALPIHPGLEPDDIAYVGNRIRIFQANP